MTMLACALLLLLQDDLAAQLRELNATVLAEPQPRMLSNDVRERIREANRRESQAWSQIKSRADWERYRDVKIKALDRKSVV